MMAKEGGLRLFVVAGSYPTQGRPGAGAFVRAFVRAMAQEGAEVCVACPRSVWERGGSIAPAREGVDPDPDAGVTVLRPPFVSFSARRVGRWINTAPLTQRAFDGAARRALARVPFRPDATYGHFLYQAGAAAVSCGRALSVPAFVAVGEGTFWTVDTMGSERARRDFAAVSGFIAVSTPVREGLSSRFGFPAEKIGLFPNGVDRTVFRPGNRAEARRKLGLGESSFVIAFVGAFDQLKGGARLVEAARGLPGTALLLVGEGEERLESPEVAFRGTVPHAAVPGLLAAADVFALPTLEEGSCNSVLEAMACGLPIVTSNGTYMDDLVDGSVALRVDAMSIPDLRSALELLRQDAALRQRMAAAAVSRAAQFDIQVRARRVIGWMKDRIARVGYAAR